MAKLDIFGRREKENGKKENTTTTESDSKYIRKLRVWAYDKDKFEYCIGNNRFVVHASVPFGLSMRIYRYSYTIWYICIFGLTNCGNKNPNMCHNKIFISTERTNIKKPTEEKKVMEQLIFLVWYASLGFLDIFLPPSHRIPHTKGKTGEQKNWMSFVVGLLRELKMEIIPNLFIGIYIKCRKPDIEYKWKYLWDLRNSSAGEEFHCDFNVGKLHLITTNSMEFQSRIWGILITLPFV